MNTMIEQFNFNLRDARRAPEPKLTKDEAKMRERIKASHERMNSDVWMTAANLDLNKRWVGLGLHVHIGPMPE